MNSEKQRGAFRGETASASTESISAAEEITRMHGTEGWKVLSRKQKEIIAESLTKPFVASGGESGDRASEWYCHAAIWGLEHERSINDDRPELDDIEDAFFEGEYILPTTIDEVRALIRTVGYPAVVHITRDPLLTLLQAHTFLVLGEDERGALIVWEKESEDRPFRLTTLEGNYRLYTAEGKAYYWGARRLGARSA